MNTMDEDRFQMLYQKYLDHRIEMSEYLELVEASESREFKNHIGKQLKQSWEDISKEFDNSIISNEDEFTDKRDDQRPVVSFWWIYAAAAVAIILFFLVFTPKNVEEKGWENFSTASAETMEVRLPDGSIVTLNANSNLQWRKDWRVSKQREVFLTGEAYFDVSSVDMDQKQIPFQVRTNSITINVIGTTFNVTEYGEEAAVYLEEGQIELSINDLEDSTYLLEEGDQVVVMKDQSEVSKKNKITREEAMSWIDGELRYKNVMLGHILTQLESIYGVEFSVQDSSILNIPMNFGAPYENWPLVKRALEMSLSVKIISKGDKMIIAKPK